MGLLIYSIIVGLLFVYILHKYHALLEKYSDLADEVVECHREIERIKTLNKLKVDCNGEHIIYEEYK